MVWESTTNGLAWLGKDPSLPRHPYSNPHTRPGPAHLFSGEKR